MDWQDCTAIVATVGGVIEELMFTELGEVLQVLLVITIEVAINLEVNIMCLAVI